MNAERLHAISLALKEELSSRNIITNLQNLINSLQAVVQQSNQSTQQNLSSALEITYSALENAPSDKFSPTWRQILVEIGGEGLFGKQLKDGIESVIGKNQITLTVAFERLNETLQRLRDFSSALDQVTSGFQTFRIGEEKLAPGECEIGILIPRKAVRNRLGEFAEELGELTFILNTFSEVATGKADELSIKTVSSTDLLVFGL